MDHQSNTQKWVPKKLNELGFIGRGKSRHRPRNDQSLYDGPYPFIQTAEVTASNFHITSYSQTYSQKGLDQSKMWDENTLCIVNAGENTGETAILKFKACFPDSIIGFVADPNKSDVRFIKYYLDILKPSLRKITKGATQDNLSVDKLLSFDIFTPSVEVQKEIADILSAYDYLIENNTRRIKILEEMAQMIYREWFVNFRFPGHEKVKMFESPLGLVPDGWVRDFSEYVDFLEGPGLRRWQYTEKGIPFLNIRTLLKNDVDLTKVQYIDKKEFQAKYSHFLLQPFDHVVSSSGTIGKVVTIQDFHLPLMLNTSIIRMKPKDNLIGKWQLKHFLKSQYFQSQINSVASGVAQINFGPMHLKSMWIVVPTEEVAVQYEKLVEPIEELICSIVQKNNLLKKTRDLLLPKLILNEIGFKN
jgi:type I restriction enzyme, S subunit